jgi:hypothetical protein
MPSDWESFKKIHKGYISLIMHSKQELEDFPSGSQMYGRMKLRMRLSFSFGVHITVFQVDPL